MIQFRMPSLGADMEAATMIEWQIRPGDFVHHGDVIAVVETDKGAIEIESFDEGVLEKYLVELGETVPVGTPLAIIRADGATDDRAPEPESLTQADRLRISPAARRLAEEAGINPASIRGSGPSGEITRLDVLGQNDKRQAIEPVPARPSETSSMSPMREAIGAAMARSKREIPHYYLQDTIDLTRAQAFITEYNGIREPHERLILASLSLKAVALAAKKFPEFNGQYVDDRFQANAAIHIGLAIRLRGGGLVAPAIHHVDSLTLQELMARSRDLVTRVRDGKFRATELADPTITVTSLGERGVDGLYGVIYPPQVAIVGLGRPATRPWVVDDQVLARLVVNITLAADHRVSDGHRGALFLRAINNHLQNPDAL